MVPQVHGAAHPGHDVLRIDDILPVQQPDSLVHSAGPGLCPQAQVQAGAPSACFQRFQPPPGIGRFPMNGMLFAPKRRGIAAERQAKEVAAQGTDNRRQRTINRLFRPRRDRVGLKFAPFAIEGDWAQVAPHFRDEHFDLCVR